jgi:NACHT domain- and WD repeat-containing protein
VNFFLCSRPFRSVDWSETGIIDPEQEVGEQYLQKFRNQITEKLRNSIESSLAVDPDGGKGRKKTVQVSPIYMYKISKT